MVADGCNGAGVGGDRSEKGLAVVQQTNGEHPGLPGQPSLQTPPSTSTSDIFASSASQTLAVSSTDAVHSLGTDSMTNVKDTGHGAAIAGKTYEKGSKHRRRSSVTATLSADTPPISKQDTPQKPRRLPLGPVSPELPLQLSWPFPPFRPTSSSRTRNVAGQSENGKSAMELQQMAVSAMPQGPTASDSSKRIPAAIAVYPVSKTDDGIGTLPQSTQKPYGSLALPHYEGWIRNKAARSEMLSRLRAAKESIHKKILRTPEIPASKDGRHIVLDHDRREPLVDERTGRAYVKNSITSSRYTLYNFIPRQLFAQFSKLANFYFLCVSLLQMIPNLSTTGTYTTIVPLAFFVVVSMAKEGYDDLRRYRLDTAENRKTALVLSGPKASGTSTENVNSSSATSDELKNWIETKWEDIGVGDVVKLTRDEAAPADIVVLHTDGAEDTAYVETMALDGETNLKSKQALPQLARSCMTVGGLTSCKAHIVVEDPNIDLYKFEGKVTIGDETLPLANNEIIYRGSVLRNTSGAIGLVVYSGQECKIRMNATRNPRIKAVSRYFL